jgi:Putative MetA-pathway of phenol degradation
MTKFGAFLPVALILFSSATVSSLAQGPSPCPTQVLTPNPVRSADLVCLVPQVYGAGGLVGATNGGPLDDTQGHQVHFQASSVRSFGPINAEIGVQLSQLPIAAPVAGFIFSGGVVTPTNSFGPILTDRAETLGRNKLFVSLSYQYFNFDKADGVDLKNFGAVFTHEPEPGVCAINSTDCLDGEPIYTRDVIATQNRIDLKVHQFTLVGTYGVIDKLDLSLAVPILEVRMGMGSNATIFNFEAPPVNHKFANSASPFYGQFSNTGYSFGMGDITLRTKYLARQREKYAVALGVDFRIPTGDPNNFLGSGTWGFRPFAIYSARVGRISPNASIGIQGNGSTVLAGDVTSQPVTKEHLPNLLTYSVGAGASVSKKIGLSADFIGGTLLHGTKITTSTFKDFGGNTHADIVTSFDTINLASIAAGIKFNPIGDFLITANGLFRLNDAGLHSKPVPLFGLSYTF